MPGVELGGEDRDDTNVHWKPLYGDGKTRYRAGEQRSQGTMQYCLCYPVIAVTLRSSFLAL